MSEMNEARWSVISERGCEASGLSYAEAVRLIGDLLSQQVYGTCVVTDEAAGRLAGVTPPPPATSSDHAGEPTPPRAGKAKTSQRAPRRQKKRDA